MAVAGNVLAGLDRCPNCGVAKPNLVYKFSVPHPAAAQGPSPAWFIYQCTTCFDVVCAKTLIDARRLDQSLALYLMQYPPEAIQIIPLSKVVDADLPARARNYLEQALASLSAPDGAIMLAGSAVDAMLKVAGYTDGSVYARIEQAVTDHVLTPAMKDWAHAVRLEANKPRHADVDEPHGTKDMALQTIGFAEALGEYLFSLPSRVARGKAASSKSPKK